MQEKAYRPNQWIEAGLLDRGSVRIALARADIEFTETKTMFSSLFRLKVSPVYWAQIRRTLGGC